MEGVVTMKEEDLGLPPGQSEWKQGEAECHYDEDCAMPQPQDEEVHERGKMSWRDFLVGDVLDAAWLRRQIPFMVMCLVFAVIYITNRYSSEQELIEIERLKIELNEIRYRALTRTSELTEKTRQSHIEQALRNTADSVLQIPQEPPFILQLKED